MRGWWKAFANKHLYLRERPEDLRRVKTGEADGLRTAFALDRAGDFARAVARAGDFFAATFLAGLWEAARLVLAGDFALVLAGLLEAAVLAGDAFRGPFFAAGAAFLAAFAVAVGTSWTFWASFGAVTAGAAAAGAASFSSVQSGTMVNLQD